LLAGVPTLIVPFAFDQSDNAEHAYKLGTSRTLYRNNYQAPRVANELHELLTRSSYARRASEVSQQLHREDGPGRASDLIEQVLSGTPNSLCGTLRTSGASALKGQLNAESAELRRELTGEEAPYAAGD
jgi:hypothetical protein